MYLYKAKVQMYIKYVPVYRDIIIVNIKYKTQIKEEKIKVDEKNNN